jgi:cysteine desulfurase
MIYLDYAATTFVDPEVLEKMLPYFTDIFSNPSSKHECGQKAMSAVEKSRKLLANLLGANQPSEIVFTGGASEANNLAIKGVAEAYDEPRHFITSGFEHKCTLEAMRCLEIWGHQVTYVQPGRDGLIDPRDIYDAIRPDTVLCSVMHVNNEIGTIQPIEDIGAICQERGVLFHTDATQSFGKMHVRVGGNIDMLSLSAHKIYGPKGIGLLYVRDEVPLTCQISGGSQEGGLRSGTLNVPGIVGLAAAAQQSVSHMTEEWKRMKELEELFLEDIRNRIPMAYLQGDPAHKVPWISNICFYHADAGKIRDELGKRNICVARSSACAKSTDPSHVLAAIGTRDELLEGAIRFSFGKRTTAKKLRKAAAETACIVEGLRG